MKLIENSITAKHGLFLGYLMCFGVFFSCEKSEPPEPQPATLPLLIQVLDNSELRIEYSYSDLNLISEKKSKFHYTKYHYNDKNQLISSDHYIDPSLHSSNSHVLDSARKRTEWVNPANTKKSFSWKYEYDNNGQLVKTIEWKIYSMYDYDDNHRISRRSFYHNEILTGYIDFEYNKQGNLIKERHFDVVGGDSHLATTTDYRFDDKFNPYRIFRITQIPGKYTNFNNIIKKIYTLHFEAHGIVGEKHIEEYSYEYNESGYPIRQGRTTEYIYR